MRCHGAQLYRDSRDGAGTPECEGEARVGTQPPGRTRTLAESAGSALMEGETAMKEIVAEDAGASPGRRKRGSHSESPRAPR